MDIVRWWQTSVAKIQLWSLVELALPLLLLTDFEALGFSAKTAAWVYLVLKVLNVVLTIRARNTATSVVGTKAEVEAAK